MLRSAITPHHGSGLDGISIEVKVEVGPFCQGQDWAISSRSRSRPNRGWPVGSPATNKLVFTFAASFLLLLRLKTEFLSSRLLFNTPTRCDPSTDWFTSAEFHYRLCKMSGGLGHQPSTLSDQLSAAESQSVHGSSRPTVSCSARMKIAVYCN